ncbi:MAG: putative methyltransferase [Flavobacteriales bacterium]|jgi:predicted methyltransferase
MKYRGSSNMLKAAAFFGFCVLTAMASSSPGKPGTGVIDAVAGEHRTPAYVLRDEYRHPAETLVFFRLEKNQTVVEIWPGGGWYTEILAPLLKDEGQFYAASFPAATPVEYYKKSRAKYDVKLAANGEVYDAVLVTELAPPEFVDIAPAGSADRVLTFRNVHNWMKAGSAEGVFSAMHSALKPDGLLGIVEHRAKPGTLFADMIKSGYVTEAAVIKLATDAGFELVVSSEINANSADTADHPRGVWTLPPSLRLGDTDKDKYLAIGESDRMTLLFKKS